MNTFTIDKSKKDTDKDFWIEVVSVLRFLTNQDYQCVFRYEDCDIYAIDYDYKEETGLADNYLMWLNDEEVDVVLNYRYNKTTEDTEKPLTS